MLGESVYKFEEEFARYSGTKFAISTASGTAALVLALLALRTSSKLVVTSPASFVASANAILHSGGTPRFTDITLETYTIDPIGLRSSLNGIIGAVMPVHLYGFPADMDGLCRIAAERKFAVIEDACQAHGAIYKGRRAGSIGDVGCFSFYPSKNMTVGGDGGVVVTNNETIAQVVSSLRHAGRTKGSQYIHDIVGFTERLNTVQAAIGRACSSNDWTNGMKKEERSLRNMINVFRTLTM